MIGSVASLVAGPAFRLGEPLPPRIAERIGSSSATATLLPVIASKIGSLAMHSQLFGNELRALLLVFVLILPGQRLPIFVGHPERVRVLYTLPRAVGDGFSDLRKQAIEVLGDVGVGELEAVQRLDGFIGVIA